MRKVLDAVTQRLQAFIAQRDDVALTLRCGPVESALLVKVVESLQDAAASELVWVLADDFTTPAAYAAAVVESFAAKYELVRLRQPEQGLPQWAPFPAALRDAALTPLRRLRELLIFGRSLLPAPEGMRVVWALFPLQIAAPVAYAELMHALLQHEHPFPWCHHMRIIVREVSAGPIGKLPRVGQYEPDLSPRAVEQALAADVSDATLPLAQRLQALLITAGIDYAHQRHAPALEKYQLIFRYFVHAGNLPLTALALNGMGEVHRARGDLKNAGTCFEAALIPAANRTDPALPVLMNVLMNIAALRMTEQRWATAESYYEQAQQVAAALRNPPLKVAMIEQLGEAQHRQGKAAEARATWTIAARVAEQLALPAQRQSVLDRLRR